MCLSHVPKVFTEVHKVKEKKKKKNGQEEKDSSHSIFLGVENI